MRKLVYAQSVFCLLLFSQTLQAQLPTDIVKIEEFWELKVDNPDPGYVAPQITNSFAPVRQGDVLYATLSMNHHLNGEDFGPGGLQLQLWHGERLLGQRTSDKKGLLSKPGETITWKQVISIDDLGIIRFAIRDGKSESWGSFGSNLTLGVYTSLRTLNDYRPNDSIDHSGVVFAANRVGHHRLAKVRATFRSGETKTVESN